MTAEKNPSYKGILKSTMIIGGAQVLQIGIGLARNKVIAILLGPVGIGVMGLYQSILDVVRNFTGLGINMSGVRDVAEAKTSEDLGRISETVHIINRWAWATGILGSLVVLAFCVPFSVYTFGDRSYAPRIALISVTLVLTSFSQAKSTLLQGMQQLSKLAKSNIIIALLSLAVSIPLFYLFGIEGIIPSIILLSISTLLVTSWFARTIRIQRAALSFLESFFRGLRMAKLGLFMVVNGLLATGSLLFVRSYLSKYSSIGEVGLFQATWTISTSFVGIVLNAMLTDFFPRLSARSADNQEVNRLTNEQCEITLLLGAPLLVAIMVFSKTIISVLYSGAFSGAGGLLRWLNAGSFLTLISWPIGVIFLAKGKGSFSVILDLFGSVCFILLGIALWGKFGTLAFGISAFVRSILTIVVALLLGRKASGFSYTTGYFKLALILVLPFMMAFVTILLDLGSLSTIASFLALAFIWLSSFLMLRKRIDLESIFRKFLFPWWRTKS